MKKCPKCNKNKEFKEFYKDNSKKIGLASWCKSCTHVNVSKFNKTLKGKSGIRKRSQTPEYKAVKSIAHKKRMKTERGMEVEARAAKKYRKTEKYKAKHAAKEARRRATKLQATPKWLTKEHLEEIVKIYEFAKIIEKYFEIKVDVDHIIPLQGKEVCGFHVPWNLKAIPASRNRSKGNRVT